MIILRENKNNNPYGYILEYIINNKVVGFLEYSYIYDRIEIDNIFVYEDYRKHGIASALMEYLVSESFKLGVLNISLEVRCSNIIAQKLYYKFGFNDVAVRPFYYGDEDAILMIKEVK